MLPGAPLASLIRSRYCEAAIRWIGPTSATTVPPADDPPAGPSVKSHSVPADSAASPQGPAAACACASVGKRCIRQNSSPAGRSATRFSASGLMTSRCCPSVADGRSHAPAPNMAIAAIRTRFINLRLPFRATAGYHPDGRESRLLRARPALVARAPPVVEDRRNRNDLLEAGAPELVDEGSARSIHARRSSNLATPSATLRYTGPSATRAMRTYSHLDEGRPADGREAGAP